jgi:redox-sensing transcriptional repressor
MKIAEPTVERLVQYHRLLEQLYNEGLITIKLGR